MEKVKITQEQEFALGQYKSVEGGIEGFVKNRMAWSSYLKSLQDFTPEQFALILCGWYEVEPEFACDVGDWIKDTSTGAVLQISDMQHRNNIMDKRYTTKRHATPSEIAEEKESRWWKKHNRDVWELREGDVLLDERLLPCIVDYLEENYVNFKDTDYEKIGIVKHNFQVVCFAENRLDVKTNE